MGPAAPPLSRWRSDRFSEPASFLSLVACTTSASLLRVTGRRRLAVVVVAPAGDAPVLPQPAGVPGAGLYLFEPLIRRRVRPAGIEQPVHLGRADRRPVPCRLESWGRSPRFDGPLEVVAPADGRAVQAQTAGMQRTGGYRGERPVLRRRQLPRCIASPTKDAPVLAQPASMRKRCADRNEPFSFWRGRSRSFTEGAAG